MTKEEIYAKAIAVYGHQAQMNMVTEECAELIHVLNKYRRGIASAYDVHAEIVDVEIMLGQLKLMLPLNDRELITKYKLERLERYLEIASLNQETPPPDGAA